MQTSRTQQCHQCFRWVAGRDPVTGRCRGCIIRQDLTEVQRAVLMAVRHLQPTTIHDVADEVRFASVSSASYHLRTLRDMGLVAWDDHKQRTLTERVGWPEGERDHEQ